MTKKLSRRVESASFPDDRDSVGVGNLSETREKLRRMKMKILEGPLSLKGSFHLLEAIEPIGTFKSS